MTANAAAAFLIVTLCTVSAEAAGALRLVVIVSDSNTVTNLSTGDLRRIYLGEMTRWPDGHRIVPVMLPPRSPESDMFLKRVLRTSAIDFAQAWIGAVFRGQVAAPPVVVATSSEAFRFVSTHAEAVAVIRDEMSPSGVQPPSTGDVNPPRSDPRTPVRHLNIDGRAPGTTGYSLSW